MPELPEVETIRRQLESKLKGQTIKSVEVRFGKKLTPGPKEFARLLTGKKFLAVRRRAKLLFFELSGGWNLFAHLKMSGRFLLKKENAEPSKHTHVIFRLTKDELHWEDLRKFGFLKLLDKKQSEKFLQSQDYGPEPLEKSFTWQKMAMCLRSRPTAKIKPLLMEQSCIAGIGNIYAAEALWFAKISPWRRVRDIKDEEMKKLYKGTVAVLKQAIALGGTSADSYVDAFGKEGKFVPKLKVYERAGEPCSRCHTILKKMKVGGRGSVFCPNCQK